jgi:prepilin-type N-terminal cleavage/methylation domain-containing protein
MELRPEQSQKGRNGVSLVELLISISILALVASVIMARHVDIQRRAKEAVCKQIAEELTKTYVTWKSSGGLVTGNPFGSMVLEMLGSPGGARHSTISADGTAKLEDAGSSTAFRSQLPEAISDWLADNHAETNLIVPGDYGFVITFDGTETFSAMTKEAFDEITWGTAIPFSQSYPPNYVSPFNITFNKIKIASIKSPGTGTVYASQNGILYRAVYELTAPENGVTGRYQLRADISQSVSER